MIEYTTDKKLYWSSIKAFRRFLGETLNFVEILGVSRIFRRYFQILGHSRIFRRRGNPVLRCACHANSVAERKCAGSSLYKSIYLYQKFSNASSAYNENLLWTYRSWYIPRFFIDNFFQILFKGLYSSTVISSLCKLLQITYYS